MSRKHQTPDPSLSAPAAHHARREKMLLAAAGTALGAWIIFLLFLAMAR